MRRAAPPRVASEGRRRRACAWEGRVAARASRSAEAWTGHRWFKILSAEAPRLLGSFDSDSQGSS